MAYFSKFPFLGDYQIQGHTVTVQNITIRTGLNPAIQNENIATYQEYVVKNGESALMLADRAYGDPTLYWVILNFNNVIDPVADWPLDQYSLDAFIARKYSNPQGIHHYESISTGAIVDNSNYPQYDVIPVTNYEYETNVNDAKRKIKIPLPQYATQIVNAHRTLIQS